jgi:tol-pal system protein YbgF
MFEANTLSGLCLLLASSLAALPCVVFGQSTELAGRVAKLEQSLSNRGLLDLLQEVENLKREAANLRGELENQAYAIEQLKKSQTAGYVDLDGRLQTLQGGTSQGAGGVAPLPVLEAAPADAVAGAPAPQGNLQVQSADATAAANTTVTPPNFDPLTGLAVPPLGPESGLPASGQIAGVAEPGQQAPASVSAPGELVPLPVAPATNDDVGSETAYRDAFALLKSGEYDQAISAFEAFQQQYPTSQYGDNAQFWLAEAHYVKRDFAAALPAYQAMLSRYPASKKLSHAMLKIGYSYSELGQPTEARTVLTELQVRFPGSAAAQLAGQRLAQLPANQ